MYVNSGVDVVLVSDITHKRTCVRSSTLNQTGQTDKQPALVAAITITNKIHINQFPLSRN
jgi:hypothetical protein